MEMYLRLFRRFGLVCDRFTAYLDGVWKGFGKSSWEIGTLKLKKAQLECDCAAFSADENRNIIFSKVINLAFYFYYRIILSDQFWESVCNLFAKSLIFALFFCKHPLLDSLW